jgi:hypothetical protein
MIDAIYYQPIYLILVSLLSLFCCIFYLKSSGLIRESKIPGFLLAILLSIFIGQRPISAIFADTVGYVYYYNDNLYQNFSFSWDCENYIFDNLTLWFASNGIHYSVYLTILAMLYFVARYFSCTKLFPDNSWISYLIFLGSFITFTSSVNGIKAGIASSFLALAIAYRKQWKKCIVFLMIAWGFHHAFHVCLLAFICVTFYKNTRFYLFIWFVALVLAIAHITYFQEIFAGFTDKKGADYLSIEADGWRTGMRYDFVLYSIVPIILGWYVTIKNHFRDEMYIFILNMYILLNAIWILCMYASFTNRIAALSWALYPMVITYPFLSRNYQISQNIKNHNIAYSLFFSLGFTLFMNIIYYGVLKN